MYQRPLFQIIKTRMVEPRRFIQVVAGPRQVGKTTLVNQVMKDLPFPAHYATADGLVTAGSVWLREQWDFARIRQEQNPSAAFLLILDEIQKVENWSEIVKREWDADSLNGIPVKVLLSGSSRLLLQQGLSESLTGRFEMIYAGHWSFSEMHSAFGIELNQYIWFGGYPGSAGIMDEEVRWKQYISDSIIETSISKDILMLTRVEKPALLRRLFEFGCSYSGQVFSYTKMLGQLVAAGNTTTLSHYLELLSQAGLLAGLEKFSLNETRQRSSSPKFQIFNTALISALRHESYTEVLNQPAQWGRLVESAVGAHLVNHALTARITVNYWRDRNDEVDFVIQKNGKVLGLEVSSGEGYKRKGMEAFQKRFQPHRILLIGKTGMPLLEFLKINPGDLF
ncbi:MAG: ATP-binding protein [Porphyromonadaceae bacterium]|nr:MAG: ATP-binding protein [Porphyromonadaceae bacterium]